MRYSTRILIKSVLLSSALALLASVAPAHAKRAYPFSPAQRTDLTAAPETVPTICSPAPCSMTSSDLNAGVAYLRVTDGTTDTFHHDNAQWGTDNSIDNIWSSDQSTFMLFGFELGNTIFKFTPGTPTASPMACSYSGFGGVGCVNGIFVPGQFLTTSDPSYSWTTPNILYGVGSGSNANKIIEIDFRATVASGSANPTITTVSDLTACSGMPSPNGYASIQGVNSTDTRFSSMTGAAQNAASLIYVYDTVQAGCRYLRTDTFQIGGTWGTTGSVVCHDSQGSVMSCGTWSDMHGAQMSPDGRWIVFSRGSTDDNWFWDISTNNVYVALADQPSISCYVGGHMTIGFDNLGFGQGGSASLMRKFTFPGFDSTCNLWITTMPSGFNGSNTEDWHDSWHNQAEGTLPPLTSSPFGTSAPTTAWEDEIIAVATDGSNIVWRLAHMYTRAHDYNSQGLQSISHDGGWILFCSDWNNSGRDDVFLIQDPLVGGHGRGGGGDAPPPSLLWVVQ